jgi:Flp pilus assembly CpaE family ATPase
VSEGLWQVGWSRAARARATSGASPASPVPDASAVDALLADLDARVRHIVLDCEHLVNERTSRALDAADRILLVTCPEVGSIRASQRVLGVCQRLGYPDDKLRVVLTRHRRDAVLSQADIATALRREVFWTLPEDPVLASDDGRAVVPAGAFTAACSAMARALREELLA